MDTSALSRSLAAALRLRKFDDAILLLAQGADPRVELQADDGKSYPAATWMLMNFYPLAFLDRFIQASGLDRDDRFTQNKQIHHHMTLLGSTLAAGNLAGAAWLLARGATVGQLDWYGAALAKKPHTAMQMLHRHPLPSMETLKQRAREAIGRNDLLVLGELDRLGMKWQKVVLNAELLGSLKGSPDSYLFAVHRMERKEPGAMMHWIEKNGATPFHRLSPQVFIEKLLQDPLLSQFKETPDRKGATPLAHFLLKGPSTFILPALATGCRVPPLRSDENKEQYLQRISPLGVKYNWAELDRVWSQAQAHRLEIDLAHPSLVKPRRRF